MDADQARLKVESMLRRAGLSEVSRPVLVCAAVVCALLVAFALARFWPAGPEAGDFTTQAGQQTAKTEISAPAAGVASGETGSEAGGGTGDVSGSAIASGAIAVDVEGAVAKPGVYELSGGARVADAIEAAGGLSRQAARTSVNLAQKLSDGTQVYVATKKEAKGAGQASSAKTGALASQGVSAGDGATAKVNINTATVEELQALSGIGPALSQRIVEFRESKGPFESIEGLKDVSGIGDAKFAAIEDSVCI